MAPRCPTCLAPLGAASQSRAAQRREGRWRGAQGSAQRAAAMARLGWGGKGWDGCRGGDVGSRQGGVAAAEAAWGRSMRRVGLRAKSPPPHRLGPGGPDQHLAALHVRLLPPTSRSSLSSPSPPPPSVSLTHTHIYSYPAFVLRPRWVWGRRRRCRAGRVNQDAPPLAHPTSPSARQRCITAFHNQIIWVVHHD